MSKLKKYTKQAGILGDKTNTQFFNTISEFKTSKQLKPQQPSLNQANLHLNTPTKRLLSSKNMSPSSGHHDPYHLVTGLNSHQTSVQSPNQPYYSPTKQYRKRMGSNGPKLIHINLTSQNLNYPSVMTENSVGKIIVHQSKHNLGEAIAASKKENLLSFRQRAQKQGSSKKEQLTDLKKFKISDFEVGKKLGKGKFGDVYLAREKKTNFLVALKVLSKTEIKNMKAEKQVVREIKIHSYLKHKNVIQLYGVFHDDENIYMILEYAPGGELYKELKASVRKTSIF